MREMMKGQVTVQPEACIPSYSAVAKWWDWTDVHMPSLVLWPGCEVDDHCNNSDRKEDKWTHKSYCQV